MEKANTSKKSLDNFVSGNRACGVKLPGKTFLCGLCQSQSGPIHSKPSKTFFPECLIEENIAFAKAYDILRNVSLQQCAKAAKTYWTYDPRANWCFINPSDFENPEKLERKLCEKNHLHCRISGSSKCTLIETY